MKSQKERRAGRPTREEAAAIDLSVIEGARKVFCERGPSASMDDVADAIGVTKLTIYRRFPSKERLLLAIIDHDLERLGQSIASLPAGQLSPLAHVHRIVRTLFEFTGEPANVQISRLFVRELYQSPRLRERVARWQQIIADCLIPQIAAAQDEGVLATDESPSTLCSILLEMISARREQLRYDLEPSHREDPEKIFDTRWRFFLRGAGAEPLA